MIGETWAIIPMKGFAVAKTRLAGTLSPAQREGLARALYLDVLDMVGASGAKGVSVVTPDGEVSHLARSARADVISDHGSGSMNGAIAAAFAHCRGRARVMLVVPADLPYLRSETLRQAAEASADGVCLVEAERDGGTNLLGLRSRTEMKPHFGPGSFRRHLEAARIAGLRTTILTAADAAFDLDTAEDLSCLVRSPPPGRVGAFLANLPPQAHAARTAA